MSNKISYYSLRLSACLNCALLLLLCRRLRRMRNSRSTRVVILVSAIFAALELPAVASKFVNDAFSNEQSVSLHSLHLLGNVCVVADSLINFVVYLSANRSFRRKLRHRVHAMLSCHCCCCCCSSCCRPGDEYRYGYGDNSAGVSHGIAEGLVRRSSVFLSGLSRRGHGVDRELHSFTDSSVLATAPGMGNGSDQQLSTFSWLLRSSSNAAERNRCSYSAPDCRIELQLIQQEQQQAQNLN